MITLVSTPRADVTWFDSTEHMSHVLRRRLMIAAAGIAAVRLARAQSSSKVYRIGYLGIGNSPYVASASSVDPSRLSLMYQDAFREEMRKHGWIEGKNYVMDRRYEEGKPERYPALAKELIDLGPDVLMSVQTPGIRALMQATRTIPIVMIAPGDPESTGLIASYAHPGGNVTGLAFDVDLGTYLKQVEMMREIIPNLSSIAVFINPLARLPTTAPLAVWLPQSRRRSG